MSCRGQGPGLGYRGGFQISQGYVGDILGTLYPFDPEMGEAVVHRIMSPTSAGGGRDNPQPMALPLQPTQEMPQEKGSSQQHRHYSEVLLGFWEMVHGNLTGPLGLQHHIPVSPISLSSQLLLQPHQGPTSHWQTWRVPVTTT